MSSFLDCIRRAMSAGATDRQRADATQEAWQRQYESYRGSMGERAAQEQAYRDVKEAFRRDKAVKRHRALSMLRVMAKNEAEVKRAKDVARAATGKLERLPNDADDLESTRYKQDAIQELAFSTMSTVFQRLRTNITGGFNRSQKVLMDELGRALKGEQASELATAMAQAIREANEMLRTRFNEAGGHIEELPDWGFRQSWDWRAIRRKGQDAFLRAQAPELFDPSAAPRIDWSRIEHRVTGVPLSRRPASERLDFLRDVYDSGTTSIHGPVREPRYGPGAFGDAFSDRHAHQRILHYTSFDSWKAVNDELDGPDLFMIVTNHVRSMARDIALMEDFGPVPRYGLEHRIQVARKEAHKRDLARGDGKDTELRKVRSSEPRARAMMSQIDGMSGTPEGPRQEIIANFFSNVRSFNYASLLGSAVLASTGDVAATRLAARVMQINPNNILANYSRLMASQASRDEALRMGWVADTLIDHGAGTARFMAEIPGSEFMARLTGGVMRAQGLSLHTDMLRLAVRMEMQGVMAGFAGKRIDELPDEWQRRLRARSITDSDWAAFTDPAHHMKAGNGATFVQPHYWLQVAGSKDATRIATSMQTIIEEVVEASVPTRSVTGRAMVMGQNRPGTLLGELGASGLSMKGFAISTWLTQSGQFMAQPTPMSRAKYAASFFAWFMAMGAIAIQLKELAKGNDPRPMDSGSFWAAAVLQGGGLGIVGDLASQTNTRIGGLGSYILGPTVGLTEDLARLTGGNVQELFLGEETNAGRELSRFIQQRTPGVSSLWYTRTAWDRIVADSLQELLDPEAQQSFRATAQRQERNFGNASWWAQGEVAPARAPDMSTALGQFAP